MWVLWVSCDTCKWDVQKDILTFCPGFVSNMSVHRQYFPDEEDETGAAKALMRLQDTYQLDSEAFSKGKLPGKQEVCVEYKKAWKYHKGQSNLSMSWKSN